MSTASAPRRLWDPTPGQAVLGLLGGTTVACDGSACGWLAEHDEHDARALAERHGCPRCGASVSHIAAPPPPAIPAPRRPRARHR